MHLNCSPGDLAIVVYAHPDLTHLLGKIITVTRLDNSGPNPGWFTEPELRFKGKRVRATDRCLKPLRWSNDIDEHLAMVGKPKETT